MALKMRTPFACRAPARTRSVVVRAATWQKATSKADLKAAGGKQVGTEDQAGMLKQSHTFAALLLLLKEMKCRLGITATFNLNERVLSEPCCFADVLCSTGCGAGWLQGAHC